MWKLWINGFLDVFRRLDKNCRFCAAESIGKTRRIEKKNAPKLEVLGKSPFFSFGLPEPPRELPEKKSIPTFWKSRPVVYKKEYDTSGSAARTQPNNQWLKNKMYEQKNFYVSIVSFFYLKSQTHPGSNFFGKTPLFFRYSGVNAANAVNFQAKRR